MVQAQTKEKLHAACDECRTRKLKCSGETPNCDRCQRERIECVYSPQKQMGRPRKRRRDGEADDVIEILQADTPLGTSNGFPAIASFSDIGLISPPHFHDSSQAFDISANITPPSHDLSTSDAFEVSPLSNLDFGLDQSIDPSLWDLQPLQPVQTEAIQSVPDESSIAPCTCLSVMYLTLTELQSVRSFSFPPIVIPLRKAMSTLSDLIHCPQCPNEMFSAIQNIQSIVALFKAIVERFNKVLLEVDAEAARLEDSGQKKPYRIGDNNPALFHLHTGTLDCPMGFNIDLEPKDWRKMVKTALRTEIYGGGSNPRPLMDLLKEIEVRQEKWHQEKKFWNEDRWHMPGGNHHECGGAKSCENLGAEHIKKAIDYLHWD